MAVDGDVRVGDAERRGVDTLLQRACGDGLLSLSEYDERSAAVWAARTRGELALVTEDLPMEPAAAQHVSPPAPSGKHRWGVAVFGEERLRGPVTPGQKSHSVAVMGHGVVDLRRDDLPPRVTVTATAVMGSVEVLVPEGARVEANGFSVMGSREVDVAPPLPGAPLIRIHATSVMGSVEVKHQKLGRKDSRREGMSHALAGTADARPARRAERPARRAQQPARREQRHRGRYLLGAAIVAVAVAASAEAFRGDSVSIFGDRSVTASPGQEVDLGSVFGDTRVIVPKDAQVVVVGTRVFGDVNGATAGGASGPTVRIRSDSVFGDLTIVRSP